MTTRASRGAVVLLMAVLVATVALVAVALRGSPPPSRAEQAQQIASGLRCPVCKDLSAADSPAPLARQMRRQIREDVAAGRTADQIRERYVAAYGPSVLMSPPKQGAGAVVAALPRVVPLVAALVGALLLRRWLARGRSAEIDEVGSPPSRPAGPNSETRSAPTQARRRFRVVISLGVATLLVGGLAATLVATARPETPAAASAARGPAGPTAEDSALRSALALVRRRPHQTAAHLQLARAYAAAGQQQLAAIEYLAVAKVDPGNAEANTALAMMAFVSGAPTEAKRIVDRVLRAHPRYPEALYTRGMVQLMGLRRPGPARADLRAYVQVAPYGSHIQSVRTLLALSRERGGGR